MKINLTSVFVDDQDKALKFYTEVLGFLKKKEIPLGGDMRWLTVVSADAPNGTELVLEPSDHPAVAPSSARCRTTASRRFVRRPGCEGRVQASHLTWRSVHTGAS